MDRLNFAIGAIRNKGNNNFLFNCSTLDTLPNVLLQINGHQLVLTPQMYVRKRIAFGKERCDSLFVPEDQETSWVLGDPFLHAYYTQFDVGNRRLGFAPLRRPAV